MPVATGTCRASQLTVSKTEILLNVPEERLYSSSHRAVRDEMTHWHVDLIRYDVPHARFPAFLLLDQQLHVPETAYLTVSELRYGKFRC